MTRWGQAKPPTQLFRCREDPVSRNRYFWGFTPQRFLFPTGSQFSQVVYNTLPQRSSHLYHFKDMALPPALWALGAPCRRWPSSTRTCQCNPEEGDLGQSQAWL